MRIAGLMLLVFVIGAGCANQRAAQSNDSNSAASPVDVDTSNSERRIQIPLEFSSTDFKNFSYPTRLRGNITLKDGEREFENPGGGGDTFQFIEAGYADITGDDKKEAIVHLSVVSCGGSCDGGSHLFYFYSVAHNKPRLLSRLETGSAGYGECGLKSFVLANNTLTLELFQICRRNGVSFRSLPDPKNKGGKFEALCFTRFELRFQKRGFVGTGRHVFAFPQGDTRNYEATVSFGES